MDQVCFIFASHLSCCPLQLWTPSHQNNLELPNVNERAAMKGSVICFLRMFISVHAQCWSPCLSVYIFAFLEFGMVMTISKFKVFIACNCIGTLSSKFKAFIACDCIGTLSSFFQSAISPSLQTHILLCIVHGYVYCILVLHFLSTKYLYCSKEKINFIITTTPKFR